VTKANNPPKKRHLSRQIIHIREFRPIEAVKAPDNALLLHIQKRNGYIRDYGIS
jgi:hypothetical protein